MNIINGFKIIFRLSQIKIKEFLKDKQFKFVENANLKTEQKLAVSQIHLCELPVSLIFQIVSLVYYC